jgi:uncharacterized protein YqiB (DUF1249 family)
VQVSKNELKKNQLDSAEENEKAKEKEQCDIEEYNDVYANLKRDLPNSEWVKLGDSVARESYEDVEIEYYDPELNEMMYYTDYQPVMHNEFELNEEAIPNILNRIYENASIDSADFCEKVRILEVLSKFVSVTKKTEAVNFIRAKYSGYLSYMPRLNAQIVEQLIEIIEQIESKKVEIH